MREIQTGAAGFLVKKNPVQIEPPLGREKTVVH
jgi:hypothetical protein